MRLAAGAALLWAFAGAPLSVPAQQGPAQEYNQRGLDLVYSYYGSGQTLAQAEDAFEQAGRLRLPEARIALSRGELKLRTSEFSGNFRLRGEARYLVAKSLDLDKSFARTHAVMGRLELDEGCIACAKLRAEDALRLDPALAEGYYLRALVHAAVRDDEASRTYLRRAVELEMSKARRVAMLSSYARLAYGRRQATLAQALLKEAIELSTTDQSTAVRTQYAELLIREHGVTAEALQHARAAAGAGSADAKELLDLAAYMEWAQRYLTSGHDPKGYVKAAVYGYLPPQQAFVKAAGQKTSAHVTRALLKAGTVKFIDVKDPASNTALIASARGDDLELARELVARKASVNAQNENSERALTFFVAASNGDAVAFLISQGAEVNYTDRDGMSPLAVAVRKGDVRLTQQLLRAGARPQQGGAWSAARLLIVAAELGNVTLMQNLIAHGVPVNGIDAHGQTPLIAAVISGHAAAAKILLEAGADIRQPYRGGSALDHAVRRNDRQMIDILKAALRHAA